MRLLLVLALILASFAFIPGAQAHQCSSGSSGGDCVCPAPNDGKAHQHANPGGSCQAAAGFSQSATPGGASQTPGFGVLGAAIAVGIAAMAARRR